jgi:hypothetical protein
MNSASRLLLMSVISASGVHRCANGVLYSASVAANNRVARIFFTVMVNCPRRSIKVPGVVEHICWNRCQAPTDEHRNIVLRQIPDANIRLEVGRTLIMQALLRTVIYRRPALGHAHHTNPAGEYCARTHQEPVDSFRVRSSMSHHIPSSKGHYANINGGYRVVISRL